MGKTEPVKEKIPFMASDLNLFESRQLAYDFMQQFVRSLILFPFFTGEVIRFLPFDPKVVFFLPQKTFVTDGTLRQQVKFS